MGDWRLGGRSGKLFERSESGVVFVRAVRNQYDARLCHGPRTTVEKGGNERCEWRW